jgi:hypothetical protein
MSEPNPGYEIPEMLRFRNGNLQEKILNMCSTVNAEIRLVPRSDAWDSDQEIPQKSGTVDNIVSEPFPSL